MRAVSSLVALAGAIACSGSGPLSGASGPPARITVIAGAGQTGVAGMPLPVDPVFEVDDAVGRPVNGVAVTLSVDPVGGVAATASTRTAANGRIVVTWVLAPVPGPQQLRVAYSDDVVTALSAQAVPDPSPGGADRIAPLDLMTYDGSGQVVHPDIAVWPGDAKPFRLAITPYPGGDAAYENPSLFSSDDGRRWTVPAGGHNPVEHPTSGYLSDPDLVYDPSSQALLLYYRQVASGHNIIWMARSADGVTWDTPMRVASAPDHQIVSPAVVRGGPGVPWAMWSVNSGGAGCTARATVVERRTSSDGVHWSAPAATDLAQPGTVIWHLDVAWVAARSEYWALYNTYPAGGTCVTDALYLARSTDGMHWRTAPSPVVRRGVTAAFADVIYRSTFLVDAAGVDVTFWLSGAVYQAGHGYTWSAATVRQRVDDVLARISVPSAAVRAVPRVLPPPEPDGGGG